MIRILLKLVVLHTSYHVWLFHCNISYIYQTYHHIPIMNPVFYFSRSWIRVLVTKIVKTIWLGTKFKCHSNNVSHAISCILNIHLDDIDLSILLKLVVWRADPFTHNKLSKNSTKNHVRNAVVSFSSQLTRIVVRHVL